MITLIFIVLCVVLGLLVLRMDHWGRKVKLVMLLILGVMLYFSVIGMFASDKVDLTSPKGIVNAVYIYFGWLGETAANLWDVGIETTGKVIDAVKFNQTEDRR